MNLGSPRLLVIDDREDEGIRVAKALWEAGLATRFVSYDERTLERAARRKLRGVRAVFMDINLLGGVMGQEQMNFAAVQQSIQSLLDENNGPYLLVSWSSHDDYAARLFTYLEERLPEKLKPSATARLDKADFQGLRRQRLRRAVEQRLASAEYFGLVWSWESAVFDSAAYVTSLIADLAQQVDGSRQNSIGTVLKALAAAEAGKRLVAKNAVRSYSSVLNQILLDCTEARRPDRTVHALAGRLLTLPDGTRAAVWKRRANRMINIDEVGQDGGHVPGDVYEYPRQTAKIRIPLPNVDHSKFLVGNFVASDFAKSKPDPEEQRAALVQDWRLVLVEVTPPCDHAQAKQVWHRYVVGAELSETAAETKGALSKADYLMRLPAAKVSGDAEARVLILNSRLVVSVPPQDARRIKRWKYRLRIQLLGDVIGWLSRQQSRVGHVYLT